MARNGLRSQSLVPQDENAKQSLATLGAAGRLCSLAEPAMVSPIARQHPPTH